jgi:hypothetical protein
MATYEPGARTGTAGNDTGRETLEPADMARIMLRPIASSLPLGFFAFSPPGRAGARRPAPAIKPGQR